MSVTFVTFGRRYKRYRGVTLRYIALKTEFLNNFVSLTAKRYIRYIVTCVSLFNYTKERKESNKEKKEIKSFSLACRTG